MMIKLNKTYVFFFLFGFWTISIFGQNNIQNVIEEIVESQQIESEDGSEISLLAEELIELSVNKININIASQKKLTAIPFLNNIQIQNLIKYRQRHGNITNIYELQLIEGFNEKIIRWLIPFLSFDVKEELPSLKKLWWNHEIITRTKTILQEQEGYMREDSSRYLGDSYQYYLRYIVSNRWGEAGITAEKDPGEPFFKYDNKSGFDFYSAHIYVKDIGVIKKLNIGDYSLRFGQGLNLWSGFSFGKSLSPNVGKKFGNGIMPYRSVSEANFFRGGATQLNYKDFELSIFYSNHKLDATSIQQTDSLEGEDYMVSSVLENGYHRTFNEFNKKNNLNEELYGVNLKYNFNRLNLGITTFNVKYDHALQPSDRLYNQFGLKGKNFFIKGADLSFVARISEYYGEISFDNNNYTAWLLGSNFYIDPQVTINMVYRNYHQKYNNMYSSGFGEYNHTKNESGLFTTLTFLIHKNWTLSGYADFFSSKGARFGIDTPSKGNEYALQLNFNPTRSSLLYVKFFFEEKEKNISASYPIQKTFINERKRIRLHFQKKINQFELKSRATKTIVTDNQKNHHGFLIYQDINYEFKKMPLKLYGRFAMFDADDFSARSYAYENDVLYAFSFPAYYYSGNRFYIMTKYKWNNISFWLRFASTKYHHKDKILSSLNEIDGDRVSEIKFQIRWKF